MPTLHGGQLELGQNPILSCGFELSTMNDHNLHKLWLWKNIMAFSPSIGTGIPAGPWTTCKRK